MKLKKLFLFFTVICTLFFFVYGIATGVGGSPLPLVFSGVGISPGIIELTGKRGDVLTAEVFVMNESTRMATLEFAVRDVVREKNKIRILDRPLDIPVSVARWTKIEGPSRITLEPKKYARVKLQVTIPSNATYGEHVAGMVLYNLDSAGKDKKSNGITVGTGVIGALYVTVIDETGKFKPRKKWEFGELKHKFLNGGDFTINVRNTGNVHFVVTGTYKIHDYVNDEDYNGLVSVVNVLPEMEKKVYGNWPKPKKFGVFRAKVELQIDGTTQKVIEFWFVRAPAGVLAGILLLPAAWGASLLLYGRYIRRKQQC